MKFSYRELKQGHNKFRKKPYTIKQLLRTMYYALFDLYLDMNLNKQKRFKLLRKLRIDNMLKVGKEHWFLYIHNQHKCKFREVSQ